MDSRKKEIWRVLLRVLMAAAAVWFQWRILERSMLPPESIHSRAWISSIISICVVAALTALVGVLTGRLSLTLILSTLFSLLLAVGNYYVNTLHGSPLRISELKSFGTAMDVIGGFRLDFHPFLVQDGAVYRVHFPGRADRPADYLHVLGQPLLVQVHRADQLLMQRILCLAISLL